MPNSRRSAAKKSVAVHDKNNEGSNDDFNTIMNKKLNEFIKNVKVLIQWEFQNIIHEYKNQIEEVSSTVAMLQQQVTNLKQENSNLQEKTRKDRQDLEKCCEENDQYGWHLWELKTWRKKKTNPLTKSWKQLSACLVRQVLISQMPALIVHIVLAELMTRW